MPGVLWSHPRRSLAAAAAAAIAVVAAAALASAALALTGPGNVISLASSSVNCLALTPARSPAVNLANINGCLARSPHKAYLTAGTYDVSGTIKVPSGAVLLDQGAITGHPSWPSIVLSVNDTGATELVSVTGVGGRVGFVNLNANNLLASNPVQSVVLLQGSDSNLIDDNGISGAATGAYVLCSACTGNEMLRDNIHGNIFGIIFSYFGDNATDANIVQSSDVHNNKCSGVTFESGYGRYAGGYGIVRHSKIHDNGGSCSDGLPAAAIYAAHNTAGGKVTGNQMYDNCGSDVDMVAVSHFDYENNNIYNPGYQYPGAALNCAGVAVSALNVGSSTFTGNTIENAGNPHNEVGSGGSDPEHVFEATGKPLFSDLPAGGHTVIAFVLSYAPGAGAAYTTTGNIIHGNTFIANCASPCLGLGYFTSRDTGYDASGNWSAQTTNYFTNNTPFGSNYGSRRGGGNWYAADSSCTSASSGGDCNVDDYQHNNGDWARNDRFYHY
jgi:hypothetical protein